MKIIKVSSDNIDNFNKEIKTPNLIAFVKIYSDSCGHCKACLLYTSDAADE